MLCIGMALMVNCYWLSRRRTPVILCACASELETGRAFRVRVRTGFEPGSGLTIGPVSNSGVRV